MEFMMAVMAIALMIMVPYGFYYHSRLWQRIEFLSTDSYEKVKGISGYWISMRLLDKYVLENNISDPILSELRGKLRKLDKFTFIMFIFASVYLALMFVFFSRGINPFFFIPISNMP